MINKEEFVHYIDVIKKAQEMDLAIYNTTRGAFNLIDIEEFTSLTSSIIELLEKIFELEFDRYIGSDISYFIYELEFGEKWTEDCYTDEDGNSIDISTSEKLYDFLIDQLYKKKIL